MSPMSFISDHSIVTVLIMLGVIVLVSLIYMRRRLHQSKNWPQTIATVLSTEVIRPAKGTDFLVTLTYSYFVEEYRGGEYDRDFPNEDEANYFASRIKNAKVDVRYDPKAPDDSVLDDTATDSFARFNTHWL